MVNRKEWSRVTRIQGKVQGKCGGIHLYVKGKILEKALISACIPLDSQELVGRSSYMVGSMTGTARILIELRSVAKVASDDIDDEEGVIEDADN